MRFGTTHRLSERFPDDYVRSLRWQFRHGGWLPHEITVLGDGADYDEPLQADLGGWHSKLEWFAPWNAHLRPAVVFDLDTYIVGETLPFSQLTDELWLIREFLGKPENRKGESGIFVAPSDASLCERIWSRARGWTRGDGWLMREYPHRFIPDAVDGIYSYKGHKLAETGIPDDARVICFHGKPKPPGTEGWAREWWQNSLS